MQKSLEQPKRQWEQAESWYKNWFSTSPWLSTLLPSLLGLLVGLLLLLTFGPWAFQKLTRLIKTQIDSILEKPVSIHYHQLLEKEQSSSEDGDNADSNPPRQGFDFTGLEQQRTWFSQIWTCQ